MNYLNILYKWKKLIIINIMVITLATTIITFIIPEYYKASATVMINESKNNNPLSNLGSNFGFLFGDILSGKAGSSIDKMLGYLESRRILLNVIKKFKLIDYYDIKKYKRDNALKKLRNDVSFDINSNRLIEISMIHKRPKTAAEIVNYFISQLDSLNKRYTVSYAESYKLFVEKRYLNNIKELRKAEDDFENFQKKYGVYMIPAQLKIAFESIGKFEVDLVIQELAADLIKSTQGKKSSSYKIAVKKVEQLKKKLNDIINGNYKTEGSIFLPFDNIPKLQKDFLRIKREIAVQTKLLEYTLPLYEQAKMEVQKNLPVVIILDRAIPPELKYSPKKTFIILGIDFLFLFLFILIVFRGEDAYKRTIFNNILESKETSLFNKIIKIYGLKF